MSNLVAQHQLALECVKETFWHSLTELSERLALYQFSPKLPELALASSVEGVRDLQPQLGEWFFGYRQPAPPRDNSRPYTLVKPVAMRATQRKRLARPPAPCAYIPSKVLRCYFIEVLSHKELLALAVKENDWPHNVELDLEEPW